MHPDLFYLWTKINTCIRHLGCILDIIEIIWSIDLYWSIVILNLLIATIFLESSTKALSLHSHIAVWLHIFVAIGRVIKISYVSRLTISYCWMMILFYLKFKVMGTFAILYVNRCFGHFCSLIRIDICLDVLIINFCAVWWFHVLSSKVCI